MDLVSWECPACTFVNAGSSKCDVCGGARGTSSRKANAKMVALEQQKLSAQVKKTTNPVKRGSTAKQVPSTEPSRPQTPTNKGSVTKVQKAKQVARKSTSNKPKNVPPQVKLVLTDSPALMAKHTIVNRENPEVFEVTVQGIPIRITEFKQKAF